MVCDAGWELCCTTRGIDSFADVASSVDRATEEASAGVVVGVGGARSKESWSLIEGN